MTRKPARKMKRYFLYLVLATAMIVIATGVGSFFGDEVSMYARGARVYAESGCGACHESLVLEPIARHRKPAPHVFEKWIDASELSERIRFGDYKSDDYAVAQRSIPRKIKMPAYNDRISDSDLMALVVFVQVNQLVNLPSASAGQKLAREYGCFNCHGTLGLGGVVNPGSLKGYIPGWFGRDFDELTSGGDREIVAEWIRGGASSFVTDRSLGRGTVARHFGESQTIKMPSFERRIPLEDVDPLVDYVLLLRGLGDMNPADVQRYKSRYALATESSEKRQPEEDEEPDQPEGPGAPSESAS